MVSEATGFAYGVENGKGGYIATEPGVQRLDTFWRLGTSSDRWRLIELLGGLGCAMKNRGDQGNGGRARGTARGALGHCLGQEVPPG